MKQKNDERLPLGAIECQGAKKQDDRNRQHKENDRANHRIDDEEGNSHPDHPQKLPPRERTSDLVLDIDELRGAEHHSACMFGGRPVSISINKKEVSPS